MNEIIIIIKNNRAKQKRTEAASIAEDRQHQHHTADRLGRNRRHKSPHLQTQSWAVEVQMFTSYEAAQAGCEGSLPAVVSAHWWTSRSVNSHLLPFRIKLHRSEWGEREGFSVWSHRVTRTPRHPVPAFSIKPCDSIGAWWLVLCNVRVKFSSLRVNDRLIYSSLDNKLNWISQTILSQCSFFSLYQLKPNSWTLTD